MDKKPDDDLSRPSIEVRIPQIRLQLRDLAFLRSLSQPTTVRCVVGSNVIDRLRFLDLIARANVPPSEQDVQDVEKDRKKLTAEVLKAVQDKEWYMVRNFAHDLEKLDRRLEPREDDVLTEKGKQLLRTGEVKVRARKVGCVK